MLQKVIAEKTRAARYLKMRLSLYYQSEGGDRTRTCPPPPTFVLVPGSALRSLASVALSSGQDKNRISYLLHLMQNLKFQDNPSSRFSRESTNTIWSRFLCESTGIHLRVRRFKPKTQPLLIEDFGRSSVAKGFSGSVVHLFNYPL